MPDINATTDDWVSVNALSGIATGTRLKIQNKTSKYLLLLEGASKPDITDFSGELITNLALKEPSKIVTEGSPEVWVRNKKEGSGYLSLFVQEWEV